MKKLTIIIIIFLIIIISFVAVFLSYKPQKDKPLTVEAPLSQKEKPNEEKIESVEINELQSQELDPKFQELKEEIHKNFPQEGITHVSIKDEQGKHILGEAKHQMDKGAYRPYKFLAVNENSRWHVIYLGHAYSDLVPCETFEKYFFPDSMKNASDCQINQVSRFANNWKLVAGNPRNDCTVEKYVGKVNVEGWYVEEMNYTQKDWLLRIKEKDVSKIYKQIPKEKTMLKLLDASPELEKELKKANSESPIKLTLKQLNAYCEGVPSVRLSAE